MKESIILPPDARESGIKVRPPQGCEIDEVKVVDGFLTVTFKEKERKLPKSWEEFCETFPMKLPYNFAIKKQDLYSDDIVFLNSYYNRLIEEMLKFTGDRATAEAVLALCQLIQLRNCYNGDWVPNWNNADEEKYIIACGECGDIEHWTAYSACRLLAFKTKELRDEFLRCFHDLIEELKPLYDIKEGGKE